MIVPQNSLWDWSKIRINLGTKHVIYQKLPNFMLRKNIYVTGIKESSVACEYVFYRPEYNGKRRHQGIEF